ncbi:MAG: hypothetical protein ACI9J3_000396 [Parvicellaceae bacterium]|jgi:hypothetical protein
MEHLYIQNTALTPEINFSPEDGLFSIRGKSIPDDAEEFYQPVLEWMEDYSKGSFANIHLTIELEFFNISSSKRILFLMYKLNELVDKGTNVKITWSYKENDDDMFEVGQDYAFMVNIPFEFNTFTKQFVA